VDDLDTDCAAAVEALLVEEIVAQSVKATATAFDAVAQRISRLADRIANEPRQGVIVNPT
jgi:hypothetical protein